MYNNVGEQNRIDYRLSSTIITCTEILSMITALVIILSMFGINVSALFFPAGVAIAFASKDLVHNFLAGAQPSPSPCSYFFNTTVASGWSLLIQHHRKLAKG
jgi:hypothetical protein